MECIICNKSLVKKQTKYCSIKCKNIFNQNYVAQRKRGLSRKQFFVEQIGGRCSICGYNQNLAALCFHHLNPKEKKIELTMQRFSNATFERLQEEVKKCVLLCCNCHTELHYPDYKFSV